MAGARKSTVALWRRPAAWLALAAIAFVAVLFTRELEQPSPGPLTAVHARVDGLTGRGSCRACHGGGADELAAACTDCHTDIGADLRGGTGLHGTLEPALANECGRCHGEHHGADFELVSSAAFAAAGVADIDRFDHRSIGVDLTGRHTELACTLCHEHARAEVLPQGARRFGGLDVSCASCHTDPHEGALGASCSDCHGQSDPFGPPEGFAHTHFDAGGAHAGLDCAACHEPRSVTSIERAFAAGPERGVRTCGACHAQPHGEDLLAAGAFVFQTDADGSCSGCHDPRDGHFAVSGRDPFGGAGAGSLLWSGRPPASRVTPALHARAGFALDGAHAELDCARCHGDAADAAHDFTERFPGREREDCAACHTDPHAGEFSGRGPHACAQCHRTAAFTPARFDLDDHRGTAFPLHGAHTALDCAACHTQPSPGQPLRLDAPGTSCADCHTDAHRGEFAGGPFADASCAECHSDTAFRPARFDLATHARTGFALEGAHGAVACGACHVEVHPNGPRSFGGAHDTCSACHADAHRGAFDSVPGAASDCARCHSPTSFADVDRAAFDHGWTGFALTGAHADASCASCHPQTAPAGSAGRTFGSAVEHFAPRDDPSFARCDTCHADAHGDVFARGASAAPDCAACHGADAFSPAAAPFDHGASTGFDLTGGHGDLDCAACHVEPAGGPYGSRDLGLVRGASCVDCHGDPHYGQFEQTSESCARCHDGAERLTFDHERDARFALGAQHADVDCASCHQPWPLAGGGSVVRYRPLGRRCVDCHGTVGGR